MKRFVFTDHKTFVRSICFPLYNTSISYDHVHANQRWRVFDIFVVLPVRSSTRTGSLIICRCISQTFLATESKIKMLVSILDIFFFALSLPIFIWTLGPEIIHTLFKISSFFVWKFLTSYTNDDFIISCSCSWQVVKICDI